LAAHWEPQPATSTFRFSDEPPPFEWLSRPDTEASADASVCAVCAGGAAETAGRRLLGIVAESDSRFADFVSPLTNPVYFETPRTVSESRVLYLHQRAPREVGGGEYDLWLLQLRAALNSRLSLVVNKGGFIATTSPWMEDGWSDVSLGAKYNVWAAPAARQLLSVGLTYELPAGGTDARQGNGSGVFDLFVTGGFALRNWYLMSATGWLLPVDRAEESSLWFWSQHLSRRLGRTNVHILSEFHWYHWLGAGRESFPIGVEGVDLYNFGAPGVAGNDIVTAAMGFRYKPSDHWEMGLGWEVPLTERRDLLNNRLTVDCILRY
jgi:hypothetical protein